MAAAGRIRWDRVGRIALLCVLVGMLYLYVGPTRSWIATYKEAGERRAEVAQLKQENRKLRSRRDQLRRPGTLEKEARLRGMVRAGERAYVVQDLPR
jgi:cell division protein FtsB